MNIVLDSCPNCKTSWGRYPNPNAPEHSWSDAYVEGTKLCIPSEGMAYFVVIVTCMSGEPGTTWYDHELFHSQHKGCGHTFDIRIDIPTVPTVHDISNKYFRHLPVEEQAELYEKKHGISKETYLRAVQAKEGGD